MSFHVRLVTFVFLVVFAASLSFAGPDQQLTPHLQGVSPLKVYFDVNLGVAKGLELRLQLINRTFEQLVGQGSVPEFIVGFRGKASSFITKGDGYVASEDLAFKRKIHQWVKAFQARGIRMEQCQIAADLSGIESQDFLAEVKVVRNGYVSMITYQNQGFAQIPMD